MSTLTLKTKNPAGEIRTVTKEFTKLVDAYMFSLRFYNRCKANNVACKIMGQPGGEWLEAQAAKLRRKGMPAKKPVQPKEFKVQPAAFRKRKAVPTKEKNARIRASVAFYEAVAA